MIIARWHIDARFGQKPAVIDAVKTWCKAIGSQIGWTEERLRITTGAIGALESTVELEVLLDDMIELEASWNKLGSIAAHKEWGQQIEPRIVSGSTHWQIFRVVEQACA